MAQKYKSKWTGLQVDTAVGEVAEKVDKSEVGTPNGVAPLDENALVPLTYLPESIRTNLNLENGTGAGSAQQKQDGTSGTFDFTNKNPNATALDPTLTGQIPYGATGAFASSFGGKGAAQGKRSFQAGTSTIAKGSYSAAFGDNSIALGNDSFVANYQNTAKGPASAAFGQITVAEGESSFAEGTGNIVKSSIPISSGSGSGGSEGGSSVTPTPDTWSLDENIGNSVHVEGRGNIGYGVASHAENGFNVAYGHYSHVGGDSSVVGKIENGKIVGGKGSFAHGTLNKVYGDNSAAFGNNNMVEGDCAFVSGGNNQVQGDYSQVLGANNTTTAQQNIVLGENNTTTTFNTVAIGYKNKVDSHFGVAIGRNLNVAQGGVCAVGLYNSPKGNTRFEVGNGSSDNNRVNAFEVLNDGRAKVQSAPIESDDVVRKAELDSKLDKTGGTLGGNLTITGDLTVNGTEHINNVENLNVKNAMIYSNADGATLAQNGGIGIKKNATDTYGIVYDPNSDAVKLGLGKADANGKFTFNANEGAPVAIRDDSSKLTNGHLVKWDGANNKLIDGGALPDTGNFVKLDDVNIGTITIADEAGYKTSISSDGIKIVSDGPAMHYGEFGITYNNHLFTLDPLKSGGVLAVTSDIGDAFSEKSSFSVEVW